MHNDDSNGVANRFRTLLDKLKAARDAGAGLTHEQVCELLDESGPGTDGGGGPGEED